MYFYEEKSTTYQRQGYVPPWHWEQEDEHRILKQNTAERNHLTVWKMHTKIIQDIELNMNLNCTTDFKQSIKTIHRCLLYL